MMTKATVVSRSTFPAGMDGDVVDAFLSLPGDLCPTHHRRGERGRRNPIGDPIVFRNSKAGRSVGFFLLAPRARYDLQLGPDSSTDLPITCDGYKILVSLAEKFLTHLARTGPIFGYCCSQEEEDHRHLLKAEFSDCTLSGYYGRDVRKYIPGLYWLTLVSDGLLEKHGVPLSMLDEIALERTDLGGGIHLFRFHEKPEDWRANMAIDKAYSATPGFFDLQKVRSQLKPTDDHRDLLKQLRPWD